MQIAIDIDGQVPLFAQLIQQIKQAVIAGQLAPRDALPSIRQLANDLDLNSKTVAKAYRLLERDSIIQTKGYRGTFVHPDARANCDVDLNAWAMTKLNETLAELTSAGVTDSEIRIAFGKAMNSQSSRGD